MAHETDEAKERSGPTWRYVALGASSLVLTIGGMAIGFWSESLDKRLEDIRATQQASGAFLETAPASSRVPPNWKSAPRTKNSDSASWSVEPGAMDGSN